jgi:hypothetical protein
MDFPINPFGTIAATARRFGPLKPQAAVFLRQIV